LQTILRIDSCLKILFLDVITYDKKTPNDNEWESNHRDYEEANPNGLGPIKIQHKYKRAQGKANHNKYDAANFLPFPSDDKEGY
jgi:hypothetical protein